MLQRDVHVQYAQRPFKFSMKRGFNVYSFPVDRMCEAEFPGMQQHGVHAKRIFPELVLFIAPMRAIADDRMENMGKVPPQLMHPACFGIRGYQGIPGGWVFTGSKVNF